ncbi:cyclase family protein [Nocardiopsis sediminis]|uniref:Cyclase family protein n=1 Tax=Nocardiopsis sediminis TaxID=1778267 RepID=A0ABV8FHY0_9ACTN
MRVTRIVDLSRPIGPGTQAFPGDRAPELTRSATLAEEGYNSTELHMSTHNGTHADAPFHFLADGARVDELPLELFTGRAVVADVRGRGDRSPIAAADLGPWRGRFVPGAVVLLHTGWSAHYGTDRYFDHPYLAGDAARMLVDAGVRTIGIDAPSPDETPFGAHPGSGWDTHLAVLGAGGTIIENLCGLELLDFPDPWFSAFPLRLDSGDGAPVRAVAMRWSADG